MVCAGAPWRMLPHDFPRWEIVSQQTQRWLAAGYFEALVHDRRMRLRARAGRHPQPSAAILESAALLGLPPEPRLVPVLALPSAVAVQ